MTSKFQKFKTIDLPRARLKNAPYNPRKIDKKARARLQEGLAELGLVAPLVWNARTGHLVSGHQRIAILDDLEGRQDYRLTVARVDVDPVAERRLNLLLNNPKAQGEWDDAKLKNVIDELRGSAKGTGFDDNEFEKLLATLNGSADMAPNAADGDKLRKKWGVKEGQLWHLGGHCLYCGDFNTGLSRILPDGKCDFIFTDPPYGHANNDGDLIHKREAALGKPSKNGSEPRPIANDKPEEAARIFTAFLKAAATLLKPGCCCCCCCCGGGGPDPQFARWSLELDQEIGFKHAVVWDKGGLGMGWHYRRCYEFVLVAEKPGGKCHWFGGNDVPNVIRDCGKIIPRADQHPTEKPTSLAEFFIRLHSKKGDLVFEPFCGSGSTLMACNGLERTCRAAEIDPKFVGMTLERWAKATGKVPTIDAKA